MKFDATLSIMALARRPPDRWERRVIMSTQSHRPLVATTSGIAALWLTAACFRTTPGPGPHDIASETEWRGLCLRLVIEGKDESAHCLPKVSRLTLNDGTVLLTFWLDNIKLGESFGGSVGFVGTSPARSSEPTGEFSIPISKVIFRPSEGSAIHAYRVPALCELDPSPSGAPTITCVAHTSAGEIAATFVASERGREVPHV
jgi:hypothetical protein